MFDALETTQNGVWWRLEITDNVPVLKMNGVVLFEWVLPDERDFQIIDGKDHDE